MRILFIRNTCTLTSDSQIGYGIGIVATIAHSAGHAVRVIDTNTHYKYYSRREFLRIIASYRPDVLAYGITIHNAYETYEQIKTFKAAFPHLIIIAGGIHMKHCFEEALHHGADVVVNREGEKAILPLLDHIQTHGQHTYKRGLDSVSGVSFTREDGTFHFASDFPSVESLDDVPIVNYDLFNLGDFFKTGTEPGVFYVTGQRGCPFTCTFCSDELQRADTRMASADWLFRNVTDLHKRYKVRYLRVADNNITLSRGRLVDFCNKMIQSGLNEKMTLSCQTTTRFPLDEELVCLMKKAGFGRMSFGLERLTPYSLKQLNKEQPLENVHKVLSLVAKHGIDPSVFMLIGFPFETKELLDQEKKLFLDITRYTKRLFLTILTPTPGTIYYDNWPKIKQWYLTKNEHLMLRAYFANVLDMHTFHAIKRNFFGLSDEVRRSLVDYYMTFKRINHGSVFLRKSVLLSLCMKLDYAVARLSQAIFAVSPSLEFLLFRRLKAIRYYLGCYLFGGDVLDK